MNDVKRVFLIRQSRRELYEALRLQRRLAEEEERARLHGPSLISNNRPDWNDKFAEVSPKRKRHAAPAAQGNGSVVKEIAKGMRQSPRNARVVVPATKQKGKRKKAVQIFFLHFR